MALTKADLLAKIKAAKEKKNESSTNSKTEVEQSKVSVIEQPAESNNNDKSDSKQDDVKFTSVVKIESGVEYEPLKMKLAELEQALENQIPGFAFLLRDIHQTMRADPNVVTILTEDEIGLVVAGLEKNLNLTIVPAKSGSGKSKSGRTQPISADDL